MSQLQGELEALDETDTAGPVSSSARDRQAIHNQILRWLSEVDGVVPDLSLQVPDQDTSRSSGQLLEATSTADGV